MGDMYYFTEDETLKSYEQAFKWYSKAAAKEHSGAQNTLGSMYTNGRYVKKSENDAFMWFKKSANNGYSPAAANIARSYYYGYHGQKIDIEKAYVWYFVANELKQRNIQINNIPDSSFTDEQKLMYQIDAQMKLEEIQQKLAK